MALVDGSNDKAVFSCARINDAIVRDMLLFNGSMIFCLAIPSNV